MNKAIITGRLTKDVDLRTTQSGKFVTSFTVAVDRMDEGADFIDCVAWGKTAENMQRFLSKGSKVLVLGRLSKRSYEDRNGNKRSLTEVVAENVEFLDSRSQQSAPLAGAYRAPDVEYSADDYIPVGDDDLPF